MPGRVTFSAASWSFVHLFTSRKTSVRSVSTVHAWPGPWYMRHSLPILTQLPHSSRTRSPSSTCLPATQVLPWPPTSWTRRTS